LLDNPGFVLKPGMFARVEVRVGSVDDVVVIPRRAIIESSSLNQQGARKEVITNYYVYVVSGDRAEQRKLDVVYVNHEFVAVSSGVAEGERFVTTGHHALRDSALVVVTREEGSAP